MKKVWVDMWYGSERLPLVDKAPENYRYVGTFGNYSVYGSDEQGGEYHEIAVLLK